MANSPAYGLSNFALSTQNSTANSTVFSNSLTGSTEFTIDGFGNVTSTSNTIVGRSLVFSDGSVLSTASGASAVFDYTGDGVTTAFSTGNYSATSTLNTNVFISGVYQRKNQYTWSGTTLTFTQPPPAGLAIEINIQTINTMITVPAPGSVTPSTLSTGGPSWDTLGNVTVSSNLVLSGSAARIVGDMNNSTAANRLAFQNSTVNAQTILTIIPNGTATASALAIEGDSAVANGPYALYNLTSTDVRLTSGGRGTFAYLPMTFYAGGSERMRITSTGNVGIGNATPIASLDVYSGTVGPATRTVKITGGNGAGASGGIFLVSATAAGGDGATLEAIGQRSDANGSSVFTGQVALGHLRTDAAISSSGASLGRILFGGNPSGTSLTSVLYSAQIIGVSDGAWSSSSAMPTALAFYTGSSGILTNAISEAGTERMRITSTGNVGINTTAPGVLLDMYGGAASIHGTAAYAPTAPRLTVEHPSGTYGTANPTQRWAYANYGFADLYIDGSVNPVFNADPQSHWSSPATAIWQYQGSEKMRITSSGQLLINNTSSTAFGGLFQATNSSGPIGSFSCQNSATAFAFGNQSGTATYNAIYFYTNAFGTNVGSIAVNSASTSYNTTSDQRIKTNVQDADPALPILQDIKIRQFDWKTSGAHERFGVVAQELNSVAPEAVSQGLTDDDMWSVDHSKLVPMLVKALQELKSEFDDYKARHP
jgi:Chaperone of endosialidase